MAALAWLVAPALGDRFGGNGNVPLAKALIASLTVGLVWQFVLVAVLVGREQRSLRWSTIRDALWLRSPRICGFLLKPGGTWSYSRRPPPMS